MNPIMSRRLETVWAEANDERKLQATTEARIALSNLVRYPSNTPYLNDVATLAAAFLYFAKQPEAGKPTLITEEATAKLARRVNEIAKQFDEGAVMDNEMLGAIIFEFSKAGVM